MIRIHIVQEQEQIKQVTLNGHANYQEYGKDIVCAAVSATYLCTINAIMQIQPTSIQVTSNDNQQKIEVITEDEVVGKLLGNMIECLKSLEKQYPKNIKLDKEEKII